MSNPEKNGLTIKDIFIKDLSCELPKGITSKPNNNNKPTIVVNIGGKNELVSEAIWEVELSIQITLKSEDSPIFIIEIYQAGLFECKGMSENEQHKMLNVNCMEILFPYARETIDSLAVKSGMPPIGLKPVDFLFQYNQAMDNEKKSV